MLVTWHLWSNSIDWCLGNPHLHVLKVNIKKLKISPPGSHFESNQKIIRCALGSYCVGQAPTLTKFHSTVSEKHSTTCSQDPTQEVINFTARQPLWIWSQNYSMCIRDSYANFDKIPLSGVSEIFADMLSSSISPSGSHFEPDRKIILRASGTHTVLATYDLWSNSIIQCLRNLHPHALKLNPKKSQISLPGGHF